MRVPLGAIQGGRVVFPNPELMTSDQIAAFQSRDVTVSLPAVKAAFPGAVSWFYDVDGTAIVDYGDHEVRLSCTWPNAMPYTAQYGMSLSRPLPNGQTLYLMPGCPTPSAYGATPAGFGMNVSTVTPDEAAAAAGAPPSTSGSGVTQQQLTRSTPSGASPSGPANGNGVLFGTRAGRTYQTAGSAPSIIGGIPNWLLLVAAAAAIFFMEEQR